MCPDFFLGHSLPNCEYQKRLFLVSHLCQGQTAVLIIFLIKNKTSLVNNKNSQYTDSKVLKEKKLQDQHHHPPTDFPPSTLIFIFYPCQLQKNTLHTEYEPIMNLTRDSN